uniref:Uncharacterized protein n=1 Tax=Oryza sativa subsp. japonica TaxID=39947 RepID=Q67W94_ORYSJ|nr:hypothetical protein [Oryza sativa Japonica Group]BAD37575.1 hypothetical protein [Oryza sativa Japonica Group]
MHCIRCAVAVVARRGRLLARASKTMLVSRAPHRSPTTTGRRARARVVSTNPRPRASVREREVGGAAWRNACCEVEFAKHGGETARNRGWESRGGVAVYCRCVRYGLLSRTRSVWAHQAHWAFTAGPPPPAAVG